MAMTSTIISTHGDMRETYSEPLRVGIRGGTVHPRFDRVRISDFPFGLSEARKWPCRVNGSDKRAGQFSSSTLETATEAEKTTPESGVPDPFDPPLE